jgi:hypothetical protein
MKIKLLKPFRQHKAGETVDMDTMLAQAVLHRKIGVPAVETKEEKRAYETKKSGSKRGKAKG